MDLFGKCATAVTFAQDVWLFGAHMLQLLLSLMVLTLAYYYLLRRKYRSVAMHQNLKVGIQLADIWTAAETYACASMTRRFRSFSPMLLFCTFWYAHRLRSWLFATKYGCFSLYRCCCFSRLRTSRFSSFYTVRTMTLAIC